MKVTLDGVYAGAGGKQQIKIVGELTGEGLESSNLSAIEGKMSALEDVVRKLQAQVEVIQAQNLQTSVKALAVAVESLKPEVPQSVTVTEPILEAVAETPAPTTSPSKKKSAV
jgi:stress response protein SCP2